MPRSVFLLIRGLALLFVVGAAVLYWRRERFISAALETTGRVIRYESRTTAGVSSSQRAPVAYPIIEFTDEMGRTHEFRSTVQALEGTPEILPVLYLPADPERAEQKHFRAQALPVVLLASLAAMFGLGGFLIPRLLR